MISFFVTLARWTASSVTGLRDPEFRAMLFVLIAMLVSSTMFYGSVEGWSVVDSLYCFVMTLGTIGYGDLHPTTDLRRFSPRPCSLPGAAFS